MIFMSPIFKCDGSVNHINQFKYIDPTFNISIPLYSDLVVSINVFVHITDKRTPSRPLGEVKLRRARLVVRWVTTCEARVLFAFYLLGVDKISDKEQPA